MLIILFNPGHNVASYNMNRQVGVLPKNYWPFRYSTINHYLVRGPKNYPAWTTATLWQTKYNKTSLNKKQYYLVCVPNEWGQECEWGQD